MRKELYLALYEAIKEVDGVEYVGLWNHNVEFLETEEAWGRPAVFIEFTPIRWTNMSEVTEAYVGKGSVRLHIVTDWNGEDVDLSVFDLTERLHQAVLNVRGDLFDRLELAESHTNHNHEELVESIEVYMFSCLRSEK